MTLGRHFRVSDRCRVPLCEQDRLCSLASLSTTAYAMGSLQCLILENCRGVEDSGDQDSNRARQALRFRYVLCCIGHASCCRAPKPERQSASHAMFGTFFDSSWGQCHQCCQPMLSACSCTESKVTTNGTCHHWHYQWKSGVCRYEACAFVVPEADPPQRRICAWA